MAGIELADAEWVLYEDLEQCIAVPRPARCPSCHHFSQFTLVAHATVLAGKEIEVMARCGFDGCKRGFVCSYTTDHKLLRVAPMHVVPPIIPDTVRGISQLFEEIYSQAEFALAAGLNHIAGPGYRKAFEFLVKDYAIAKIETSPDFMSKKKAIIAAPVTSVLQQYYSENLRLQELSKRVLWLGNDETHYMRKWEEHDIRDLISLIKVVLNWIDSEYIAESAFASMPRPSSS